MKTIKLLPALVLLAACGSGDDELTSLNTDNLPDKVVFTDENGVEQTVTIMPEGQGPDSMPDETTPGPDDVPSGTEVLTVEEDNSPESTNEGVETMEPEIIVDVQTPDTETEVVAIEMATFKQLTGTYSAVQVWAPENNPNILPHPFIDMTMQIDWVAENTDGVDIIVGGVYEETLAGNVQQYTWTKRVTGQLIYGDDEQHIPYTEVRVWNGNSEDIKVVIWNE